MAQDPLHVVMVEPRFPGRLTPIADWLVERRGYRVHLFCHQVEPEVAGGWPASLGRGLDVVQFEVGGVAREASAHWMRGLERGICHAYGAWEVIDSRRLRPVDLVVGRSAGLGSTLFAPVSYPSAAMVSLFDYYVPPRAGDLWEEDEAQLPAEYRQWRRAANVMDLLELENRATAWTLTQWQRGLYPTEYRHDFVVEHDGVDVRRFERRPRGRELLGRSLGADTKVVSFVASSLDRLRGFDRFHALACRLLRERSDVVVVAVGSRVVDRMIDITFHGADYPARLFETGPPVDPSRYWLPGRVTPEVVAEVLAASDAHLALGRPYPMARSMLEAMAARAPVVASKTAPVREVIEAGVNGLLVDPYDLDAVVRVVNELLDDRAQAAAIGGAGRGTIESHYNREVQMPRLAAFFESRVEA